MQIKKVLLLVAVAGARAGSTESFAQRWLQTHKGSPDELAELRGVNPDAYALVSALLTKQSLGLIHNRRHKASFAVAATQQQDLAGGAEADDAISSLRGGGSHMGHNWLNWKPKSAASDDSAMVNSVLASVAGLMGHSDNPLLQSKGSRHSQVNSFNWKPHTGAEDEQMVNSVLGQVAGLTAVPRGRSALLREAPALPSSDLSLNDGVEEPVVHVASAQEQHQRSAKAFSDYFQSSPTASLASVSTPLHMHHHMSSAAVDYKPQEHRTKTDSMVDKLLGTVAGIATGRNREIILRKQAHLAGTSADFDSSVDAEEGLGVQALDRQTTLSVVEHTPQPVVLTPNSAEANWANRERPHQDSSKMDSMVDNLLGAVAGMASGKNREILLRKKAHLAGTSADSAFANVAESLEVQPLDRQAVSTEAEGKDQATSVSQAAALTPARHHVALGSWAGIVWPLARGATPLPVAAPAAKIPSLRTAETSGAEMDTAEAEPTPQQRLHLMSEFVKHGQANQASDSVSTSDTPSVDDEHLLDDLDSSEKIDPQSVAEGNKQVAAAEAKLAAQAAARKIALAHIQDQDNEHVVQTIEAHVSNAVEMFKHPTLGSKSAASKTSGSHSLSSWLGYGAKAVSTTAPKKSSGNPYMDTLSVGGLW